MARQSTPDFRTLERYYTNQEDAQALFRQLVASPTLQRRLVVVHGVGGVGKSTLLRMFHLHCLKQSVPVALASSEVEKNVEDVLAGFARDLGSNKVRMREFSKVHDRYRAIAARAEEKAHEKLGMVGTLVSKTSEAAAGAAGGAAAGALVGSVVPGIGTAIGAALGTAVGGMGSDSVTAWLSGFLDEPELELLLEPDEKLTRSFLDDLDAAASKGRIVLMLDALEKTVSMERWIGGFCRGLPENVLFVVSGRRIPKWDSVWPEWLSRSTLHEVDPLSDEDMRTLVGRYYALMRDGTPDREQEDAIVRFARGSPLVVNSTVQLWVQYNVEDFEAVQTEVAAVLVDRLLEGVPPELSRTFQAAATLRWFNLDTLRALLSEDLPESSIDNLRQFPFVRPRLGGGWALHDLVREMILENLETRSPSTFRQLHERASEYFTLRLDAAQGDDRDLFVMERLHHELIVDETAGTALFRQLCEELTRARLVHRLRTVLDDLEGHQFDLEANRLWRDYYVACLSKLEERTAEADEQYAAILDSKHAEPRLRSYALCDLGSILAKRERLADRTAGQDPVEVLNKSLEHSPLDAHLASSLLELAKLHKWQGEGDRAIRYLEDARIFFTDARDLYGLIRTVIELKGLYVAQGDWRHVLDMHAKSFDVLARTDSAAHVAAAVHGDFTYGLALMGRLAEAEQSLVEGLRSARGSGDRAREIWIGWQLAYTLGKQRRYEESSHCFRASLELAESLGDDHVGELVVIRGFEGEILAQQGRFAEAQDCLEFSLQGKTSMHDFIGLPEILERLGSLNASRGMWQTALELYHRSLEANTYGLRYFEVRAKVGKCWALYHEGRAEEVPTVSADAASVAREYEYYDQLAALRVLEGHLAWGEPRDSPGAVGLALAQAKYTEALLLAMLHNRFLLDDVLTGDSAAHTYLTPIVRYCLAKGRRGRQMLEELRNWWDAATVADSRLQVDLTVSSVDATVGLRDAERSARDREVGAADPQRSVAEQLESALQ